MKYLFLYPQDICYGILHSMMDLFADALRDVGAKVIGFDAKTEQPENLVNYFSNDYTGIIDFYSGLLSIGDGSGGYFFDIFNCPVYQLDLDYPIYILDQLDIPLKNHFILCGNDRYIPVIKESMPHIKDAYFFPMTGRTINTSLDWKTRKHDVVFLGTYNDYREYLKGLEYLDEEIKTIALTLFNVMKDDVSLDQTAAMEKTLSILGIQLDRKEMFQWFQVIGQMAIAAFAYHRERVVDTVLKGKITLSVFGDSWKASPFYGDSNLVILPAVDEEGYAKVMSEAKISINVMYGNRSGFTERYGYSMLNGAVCLSEKSDYLEKHFQDGEEILYYDLCTLDDLVDKIHLALEDEGLALRISKNARNKAVIEHSWESRVERFLTLFDYLLSDNSLSGLDLVLSNEVRRKKLLEKNGKMNYLDILLNIDKEERENGISNRLVNRFNNDREFIDYWNNMRFMAFRASFINDLEEIGSFFDYIQNEKLSVVSVKYLIHTSCLESNRVDMINQYKERLKG